MKKIYSLKTERSDPNKPLPSLHGLSGTDHGENSLHDEEKIKAVGDILQSDAIDKKAILEKIQNDPNLSADAKFILDLWFRHSQNSKKSCQSF